MPIEEKGLLGWNIGDRLADGLWGTGGDRVQFTEPQRAQMFERDMAESICGGMEYIDYARAIQRLNELHNVIGGLDTPYWLPTIATPDQYARFQTLGGCAPVPEVTPMQPPMVPPATSFAAPQQAMKVGPLGAGLTLAAIVGGGVLVGWLIGRRKKKKKRR